MLNFKIFSIKQLIIHLKSNLLNTSQLEVQPNEAVENVPADVPATVETRGSVDDF